MIKKYIVLIFILQLFLPSQDADIDLNLKSTVLKEVKKLIPETIPIKTKLKGAQISPIKIKNVKNITFENGNRINITFSLRTSIGYYRKVKFSFIKVKVKLSKINVKATLTIKNYIAINAEKTAIEIYPKIEKGKIFTRKQFYLNVIFVILEKIIFDHLNKKLKPIILPIETKNVRVTLFGMKKEIGKLKFTKIHITEKEAQLKIQLSTVKNTRVLTNIKTQKDIALGIGLPLINYFQEQYIVKAMRKSQLPFFTSCKNMKILSLNKQNLLTFSLTKEFSHRKILELIFTIKISANSNYILLKDLRVQKVKASYAMNPHDKKRLLHFHTLKNETSLKIEPIPVKILSKRFFIYLRDINILLLNNNLQLTANINVEKEK